MKKPIAYRGHARSRRVLGDWGCLRSIEMRRRSGFDVREAFIAQCGRLRRGSRLACIGADMNEGTTMSQIAVIFGELCGTLTEVRAAPNERARRVAAIRPCPCSTLQLAARLRAAAADACRTECVAAARTTPAAGIGFARCAMPRRARLASPRERSRPAGACDCGWCLHDQSRSPRGATARQLQLSEDSAVPMESGPVGVVGRPCHSHTPTALRSRDLVISL